MNDSLEELMRSIATKEPSKQLDHRVSELFQSTASLAPRSVQSTGFPWMVLTMTCATCLLIGFAVGFLSQANRLNSLTAQKQPLTAPASLHASLSANQQSHPEPPVNFTNEVARSSTSIVNQSWVRSENGEYRRAYRTLTRKQVLVFDEKQDKYVQMKLEIPGLVFTSPPGI